MSISFSHAGLAAGALAAALALTACANDAASSAGGGPAQATSASAATSASGSSSASLPTVTLMVGGIDKQIYLPYQLAQGLGYYQKYGVNVALSTESAGGVGAETAMASG